MTGIDIYGQISHPMHVTDALMLLMHWCCWCAAAAYAADALMLLIRWCCWCCWCCWCSWCTDVLMLLMHLCYWTRIRTCLRTFLKQFALDPTHTHYSCFQFLSYEKNFRKNIWTASGPYIPSEREISRFFLGKICKFPSMKICKFPSRKNLQISQISCSGVII